MQIVSFYTRRNKKSQEEEYTVNNVTHNHTPFAHVLACDPKHARVIDIMCAQSTCKHVHVYVQLSIVENESSSVLEPTANLPTP